MTASLSLGSFRLRHLVRPLLNGPTALVSPVPQRHLVAYVRTGKVGALHHSENGQYGAKGLLREVVVLGFVLHLCAPPGDSD